MGTELASLVPDHVEVGELLARTGRSELYAGRDRRRGTDVVIKVCGPAGRAALRAEARALARLGEHPHVLTAALVGHSGGEGGSTWMVTDRAQGGSLADRTGASAGEVRRWAPQLAGALAHAHALGVVHGDVTPHNVFLDSHDLVLLGDFGSAVVLSDVPASGPPSGHTPAYAAPERRGFTPATPADDVYGFAATMLAVCGAPGELPGGHLRLLRRCMGARQSRPDAAALARRLAP